MMPVPSFNLVDEPWIPCVRLDDGGYAELGLRAVFQRAHEIRELTDPSPLVTISLYRLMLAILHRSLGGPETAEDWHALWTAGWDIEQIDAYLEQWRPRFDLFDDERPFYQTAEIEYEYETSVAEVVHGFTLGNYSTLFDHHLADAPPALSPDQAARYLLAFHSFAPGGLIGYRSRHGESANPYKYAKAGHLTKAAVSLVKGKNLTETLFLNLHRYSRDDGVPFEFDGDDLPAWERDTPAQAIDRRPAGYADLLTWQSRRMRLRPEINSDGRTVVRYVVRMKGEQFPDSWHAADAETMVAFRRHLRPRPGEAPWAELTLSPNRSLWRDSAALFQAIEDRYRPPRMSRWLADLVGDQCLDHTVRFNLDVYGMSVDRANIFLWRHERFPLPVAYVEDRELFDRLRLALELAEQVGRLFINGFDEIPWGEDGRTINVPRPMRAFAAALVSPDNETGANPDDVRNVIDSLSPERVYWSRLETPFKEFMDTLAREWTTSNSGDPADAVALAGWAMTLRQVARSAFEETILGFDRSARELKAAARAERAFSMRLNQILGSVEMSRKEV